MSVSRPRSEAEADTVAEAAARRDPRLPAILAAARRHRQALAKRNADASERMYQSWLAVLQDLRPRVDAVTQRIDDARKAGETVNPAWLYQQQRYRELIEASRFQFNQYVNIVERQATGLQAFAATQAIDDTYYLLRGALGHTPDPNAPNVLIRPDAESMKDIVGFLGNGSPLHDLLATFGNQTAEAIGRALTVGIVTGRSPIEIAQSIREATMLPRSRAETIARTEMHRAYRTATQRTFEANADIMAGWIWHAANQLRTCAACWAMHGTFHPISEILHGHVRCRCTMLPQTKTWQELGIEGVQDERVTVPLGSDLFDRLSDAEQRFILGKSKYDLFKSGHITLADMAALHRNPIWGDSWQESTIAQAQAAATERLRASERANRAPRKPRAPKDQGPAPTAPDFKPGAQVRAEIEAFATAEYARIAQLTRDLEPLARAQNQAYSDYQTFKITHEEWGQKYDVYRDAKLDIDQAKKKLRERILESLYADNPATYTVENAPRKASDRTVDIDVGKRHHAWTEGDEFIRRFVGDGHVDGLTLRYAHDKTPDGRSYQYGDTVYMAVRSPGNAAHEIGHWIEQRSDGVHLSIRQHFDTRTQGEAPERLIDIFPGSAYRDTEYTKRDKWINPYSGKEYNGNSEILSMTLEQLYDDPYNMLTTDPETFDAVWRILRSKNGPKKTPRRRRTT
jgi:SPP1 gp7 family putative phage head morphogenesis protein